MKVRQLPSGTEIRTQMWYDFNDGISPEHSQSVYDEVRKQYGEDARADAINICGSISLNTIIRSKIWMLSMVKKTLAAEGIDFDEFNGMPPTRHNQYFSYEFSALWLWMEFIYALRFGNIYKGREIINEAFYKKYGPLVASVMRKYPKVTGVLIGMLDLKIPGNKLFDLSKMENADFDDDHTDEGMSDSKAEEFKSWIMKWCGEATEKDKMRVRNWFQTKKSHKQIFAEINKVLGNPYKFNARLALFVERLFDKTGTEYFFEKTGFATKEDLFMAYFEKLTQFDEETKKAFIKKYLLG